MKKLPIGVYTFDKMSGEDYLYVDKTRQIFELMTQGGGYYFLSRPRRFGKSLLVSTLKEIFLGHKELFRGLYIYDKIDWKPHPVIHLDLLKVDKAAPTDLQDSLLSMLHRLNEEHQLQIEPIGVKMYFANIIEKLAKKYAAKVVVLVDEYDKPIIDHIENIHIARANRDILKNFYGALKGSDAYLEFALLTGVSKFSQVSIFSDLNNLDDITLAPQYATLLGYTQQEVEQYFADYLNAYCQEKGRPREAALAEIQAWYDGYSWNGKDRVYNPVSMLNFFSKKQFKNYWFATGTPTFLINLIKHKQIEITEFEQTRVADILFDSYDFDRMDVITLLFQSGYLTISEMYEDSYGVEYLLDYPNKEVKEAFLTYLFEGFTTSHLGEVQIVARQLRQCLQQQDLERFIEIMQSLFAKIPYTLHIQEEAYYHSLFYIVAVLLGVEIDVEVLTDKGRIDGVIELKKTIYVIEFKYGKAGSDLNTLTEKALAQIRKKHYTQRYADDPRPCLLLGIGFVEKEIGYKLETRNAGALQRIGK